MSGGGELSDRRVRAARGVTASTVATLVALASHLAAGGAMPPMVLVLAACILSWLPGVALIGRRLSVLRQGLVILPAEGLLHGMFAWGAVAAPLAPTPRMATAAMPGMLAHQAGSMPAMSAPTPGMWVAHAAAALMTVALWSRGEAAFWALTLLASRLARVVLPVLPGVLDPFPERPAPQAGARRPSLHLERVLAARARRGPPPAALSI